MTVAQMAVVLFAVTQGYTDDVEVKKVQAFEQSLHATMKAKYGALLDEINAKPEYSDDIEKKLRVALDDFKAHSTW